MINRIQSIISHLWKSLLTKDSFLQNFSFIAGGKLFVALISFAVVPMLSRIYPPEAYGNFTLYNSIVAIVSIFALLGYPNAYILIKKDEDLYSLVSFQFTKVLTLFVLFSALLVLVSLLYTSLPIVYYFLPLGFLTTSLMTMLSSLNVRSGFFKLSGRLEGYGGVGLRLLNLIIGFFGKGYPYGLILGDLIGRSLVNAINLKKHWKPDLYKLKWQSTRYMLWRWRSYPKYILPNRLLSQFSGQVPIYILALTYDQETLGYYGMAFTVFSLPVQLLSNAVAPVYLKKAVDLYAENMESLQEFTIRFLNYANVVLLIPFILMITFSGEIIELYLGLKWSPTGFIVSLMAIPVFLELTLTPISSVLQIMKKEKVLLGLNLTNTILMSSVALLVFVGEFDFELIIALILAMRLVVGLARSYYVYKALAISMWRFSISYLVALISLSAVMAYLLKY